MKWDLPYTHTHTHVLQCCPGASPGLCSALSMWCGTSTGLWKGSSGITFPNRTHLLKFKYWRGRQSAFGHNPIKAHPQFQTSVWVGWVLCLVQRIRHLQDQRCCHQNLCRPKLKSTSVCVSRFGSTAHALCENRTVLCKLGLQWGGWARVSTSSSRVWCAHVRAEFSPDPEGQKPLPSLQRCWMPRAAPASAASQGAVCWGRCLAPQKHQASKCSLILPLPFLRSGSTFRMWNGSSKWILTVKWDFYFS